MSSDVAIKVADLSKCYHIYEKPGDRLKQFIFPRLRRLTHLPQKQYGREFWALRQASFEIYKGDTIGIVGRNGSGKSTLLQLICGTVNPSSGHVEIHGRVAALLELGSGFNPEFTGRENIYMSASILGLTEDEIRKKYNAIVEFADIGDFINQPVKTYSSGMYVRLAFAVSAHADAEILVIDEALAVGDAFFTQKCMRFLREFKKNGTILFVSHDTAAVVNLCNKALLLEGGHIVATGSPKDIAERYLTNIYEATQDIQRDSHREITYDLITEEYRDARETLINNSNLRNDIEIFQFDLTSAENGFGSGYATIISVQLQDSNNRPLSWVVGGEHVSLEIKCVAHQEISLPIIGFQFKDRLGQVIFADNTYLSHQLSASNVKANEHVIGRFMFRMPTLPNGDYTISPAIGSGSQENHIQHHWIHDALVLKVHSTSVCHGLIGVPMKAIELKVARD